MALMMRGLEADRYDRQYSDSYLFRRITHFFASYKRQLAVIALGFTLGAVVSAARPVLIAAGVSELKERTGAGLLPLLVSALFVAAIMEYALNWTRRRLLSRVIGGVVARLRQDAFAAAVDRDLAFYDENKSGKIVSRITSDSQEFGEVILLVSDVFSQVLAVLVLTVVLLDKSWQLTLILYATTPVLVGSALGFRRLARYATRQGFRAMALVNDTIQESVTGITVAKNFRREDMIYHEFVKVNQQSYRVNIRRGFVLASIFPVMNLLTGFAVAIIVMVGAQHVLWGFVSIGAWYLFIDGVDRFWFPFSNLAAFWSQFQQALSASERIFALIDAENSIRQYDQRPAGQLRGHIVFDNVSFAYKSGQPVLQEFNLEIQPGESVAFVGHTGAGKSTITKLITRFYEFQGGQIRIDGRDIRSFDLQSFRRQLGIVPQQPFLFSGTIMDNIRYSRPDAEIEEIALSIGGGEWLETLPDGLHTDAGERGARLSMGQRQLVSLLRVLVQKPAIFILDEATASVDPFTETQIQEAINLILQRSTSILIAHRLSTVRSADRIIVLREGEIIEEGHHDSLMAQGGHYAELYNTYFRHQSLSYVENARIMFAQETAE